MNSKFWVAARSFLRWFFNASPTWQDASPIAATNPGKPEVRRSSVGSKA